MLEDGKFLFHRIRILAATRFDLKFCFARVLHRHEPIDSGFAICLDLNRRLRTINRFAVDEQTCDRQSFSIQRRHYAHRFVSVVVDNARHCDLIANDKESRRLESNDERLLGAGS
jgi:hypothetical protein